MPNINVPDILSITRLSRNVSDLKSQIQVARTEVVTGRIEDLTKELNGDIGSAHLLEKGINDVKTFQQRLAIDSNRTSVLQNILGTVNQDSSRIATDALAAFGREDENAVRVASNDARTSISSVFGALNTSFSGRALFGGNVTDSSPLASPEQFLAEIEALMSTATDTADAQAKLDFYFNDPAGGFATSIYNGGADDAPKVEISPGVRIDAAVRADAQPIKDVLRGLATLATFETAPFSDTEALVEGGGKLMLAAEVELTQMRADIGVSENRIDASIEQFQLEEIALINLRSSTAARDPFDAAAKLRLLETQLEASFLLTTRLTNLTLANFLR